VFLSQNGQRDSLLDCNWLHFVRRNHFHVMILLNRDSESSYSELLLEDSTQFSSQRNRIPCIRPDDVIFRPNAQLSKHHPSRPYSVSRTFELFQLASVQTSQHHIQTSFSVRQVERFLTRTQICEDSCTHPDYVCSHSDAILDNKASRTEEVQPSGC
jgi:aspartate carbamoyltransferase regulatory subunit